MEELLPRDKFDFERVEGLKHLSRDKVILLLPHLLTWVQDMNWPIAKTVCELILAFQKESVPYIKQVFATNDDIWKYGCLEFLIKQMSIDNKKQFQQDLVRLSKCPTEGERLEEVDRLAKVILQTLMNGEG